MEKLKHVITTPKGDDVVIHTRWMPRDSVFVTEVIGGPNDSCTESKTERAAVSMHEDSVRRHKTGLYTCDECRGEGTVECSRDVAVWGETGLAGHTTEDWVEDCEECVDGECFDEEVADLPADYY